MNLFDGYDTPTPCWFSYDEDDDEDCKVNILTKFIKTGKKITSLKFILNFNNTGGMGDSSDSGLYRDDISKVGPEIIEPKF